jgi:hypothetical protein
MNLENKKQVATIALAVGLGLVAAFLMSQYVNGEVQNQTKALAADYQKKNAALIQEVEKVRGQMEAVKKEQAALAKKVSEQKVVVQKGAEADVKPVSMTSFSLQTPPGKRAFTIKIDSLSAVGGLISPGDLVDIIAHLKIPKEEDAKKTQTVTTVLFQNLQVLAVGTNYQFAGQTAQYVAQQKAKEIEVTLALDPEQSGLLSFAQEHGKLQLALRAPTERNSQVVEVASWDSLADYLLEQQGTELIIPEKEVEIKAVKTTEKIDSEVKPFIQIFKSGKETNF